MNSVHHGMFYMQCDQTIIWPEKYYIIHQPMHTCTQKARTCYYLGEMKLIPGYLQAWVCRVMPSNLSIHISILERIIHGLPVVRSR